MASKNRLGQAAETSVNGFFTNAEENKPEQESETYQEESKKEPKRKTVKQVQREQDIEKFLELLKQGTPRKDAYEAVGHDKTWASKVIAELKEKEPDLLKGTSEEIKDKVSLEQAEAIAEEETPTPNTLQEPQTAVESPQPMKNTPEEEKRVYEANTKPQKAVMGFRAEVDKIELWKLYADAAEQEISAMCTAALDEYVRNHELTADQKEIFDIKKQALEAEKMIKRRKKIVNN